MFDFIRNMTVNRSRYKTHGEAVVISCFYNPQNSPYRLLAFQKWYKSIKHLNHRIYECLIGENTRSQLPKSPFIRHVHTDSLLWHKETLLNKIVRELPDHFKYVFALDADVLFDNNDWLVEGVKALQKVNIIQPFEFCVHLEKNQIRPHFDVDKMRPNYANRRPDQTHTVGHKMMWRSFAANYVTNPMLAGHTDYDIHGHVGFAWGFRREVLDQCPFFDRGLIGGADHILAHAAAGQIVHPCITKSFSDDIAEVTAWSNRFYQAVRGWNGIANQVLPDKNRLLDYVPGDLYHVWHGDIADRQYLRRIKEFGREASMIHERDRNGLHVQRGDNKYTKRYYRQREVNGSEEMGFDGFDADFFEDMGYALGDIIDMFGQPYSQPEDEPQVPPANDLDIAPPQDLAPPQDFLELPVGSTYETVESPVDNLSGNFS